MEMTLVIAYSGRVEPQNVEDEAVQTGEGGPDDPFVSAEPNFLLSNRSYWYPQNPITDYATATLRITVPEGFACVASGRLRGSTEVTLRDLLTLTDGKAYVFTANDPLRYLALVVSRFVRVADSTIDLADSEDTRPPQSLEIAVEANPRQQGRGRALMGDVEDIMRFYAGRGWRCAVRVRDGRARRARAARRPQPGLLRGAEQPAARLTRDLAQRSGVVLEFSGVLPRPRAGAPVVGTGGRLAELSRAVAQRGLRAVLRGAVRAQRPRRSHLPGHAAAVPELGAGRIGRRARVPRLPPRAHQVAAACVPRAGLQQGRRGAAHAAPAASATRRSFTAMRRFYTEQKFQKAGTDDLRRAFEAESGRPLERFFDRWIYGAGIPRVRYARTIAPGSVDGALRAGRRRDLRHSGHRHDHLRGRADPGGGRAGHRSSRELEDANERPVRQVQINRDQAALAEFDAI